MPDRNACTCADCVARPLAARIADRVADLAAATLPIAAFAQRWIVCPACILGLFWAFTAFTFCLGK